MNHLNDLKTRHKLAVQSLALALGAFAALPVYAGLQAGSDALAWSGLITAAVGMVIGLWAG